MLTHKKSSRPLTLSQKTVPSTIDDYMCAFCFGDDLEGWLFEVDEIWYCPIHGEVKRLPNSRRYVVPRTAMIGMVGGKQRYEQILRKRNKMKESSLVVSKASVELLASEFVASVMGVKDLPVAVQRPAARFLAGIYNDYGLDARLNEVGIFPIERYNQQARRKEIVDFGIWFGMSGYERMAHNDEKLWYFGKPRRLNGQEITDRVINYCSACKSSGKVVKWENGRPSGTQACERCEGKGFIDPDKMLVYEVDLFDLQAATAAKSASVPYTPESALGICIIGQDVSWQTGTLEAKAIKRAKKALLKRTFPLQYRQDNIVKNIEINDPDDIHADDNPPLIRVISEEADEGVFEEASPPVDKWTEQLIKYGYSKSEWRQTLTDWLFEGNLTDWVDIDRHNLVEYGKRRFFLKKKTELPIETRIEEALVDLDAMVQEYPATIEDACDKLLEHAKRHVKQGIPMPVMDIEKIVKKYVNL